MNNTQYDLICAAIHVAQACRIERWVRSVNKVLVLAMLGFALFALLSEQAMADVVMRQTRSEDSSSINPANGGLLSEWGRLLSEAAGLDEITKIKKVNSFFNKRIVFESDAVVWGQNDYWATPAETLMQGRGDCEDFAIAKYFSLHKLGVPSSQLRLVYSKVTRGEGGAHMVLAYYPKPGSIPLILDSLMDEIVSADERSDLKPIFSFNLEGLWLGTGSQVSRSQLSRWSDVVLRHRQEGRIISGVAPIVQAAL